MPRVLLGQIKHETNTFSRLPTALADFRARHLFSGEEMDQHAGTETEIGGYLEAGKRYGWTFLKTVAASATPSGKVTTEAWRTLRDQLLAGLDHGPFDGIALSLHGAMVCEGQDDPQGELLAAIRRRVGADVPVVVSLDLHANVTDAMAEQANALIAYRTYPHIDAAPTALACAAILDRAMKGACKPRVALGRTRTLAGLDFGRTQGGPMPEALARAERLEREPGILAISLCAGFPWADLEVTGATVAVTYDGAPRRPRAEAIVKEFTDFIWETRNVHTTGVQIADVLRELRAAGRPTKPIVLADAADNPGAGGYGDHTGLLAALLEARIDNAAVATIADPVSAQRAIAAGRGGWVDLELGGRMDPRFGKPLALRGRVVNITDGWYVNEGPMGRGVRNTLGPTAVVRAGEERGFALDVIIASNRLQVWDLQTLKSNGIDPTARPVLAIKSTNHFRAAFEPIAAKTLIVDAGGLCTADYRKLPYEKVRRPVHPLDLE